MRNQSVYVQNWYAEEYDWDRFGSAFGQYLHDQEVETFLSMIHGYNGSVLDVGAGTGKLSLPLLRHSRQVTSVDLSSEMLRVARRRAEQERLTVRSAICDAHHLCFSDNEFECVISSRVLMHLADWRMALSEFCRVARDVVVVDFPPVRSFAALDSLFKRFGRFFLSETRTYRTLSIHQVINELKRHGFRVVALKKHYFFPILFHRLLDRPRVSLIIEKVCRFLGLVRLLGGPVTVMAVKESYRAPSRISE